MASPIEERLLEAILDFPDDRFRINYADLEYGEDSADVIVFLSRNEKISTYRADFLFSFVGEERFRLVVECDGHEWHERTKQQAAYDRARDRELLNIGAFTICFTGSEIVHSAERCAADVYRALATIHDISMLHVTGWRDGWDAGFTRALDQKPVVRRGY